MIHRAELAALLPHSGRMCLLDEVVTWDNENIRCRTLSHREPDHPLRCDAGLPAHCGIECAGQAMAIHGRLSGHVGAARIGYLASLRDVHLSIEWLDVIKAPLEVNAWLVSMNTSGFMYRFAIEADCKLLITGSATVFLGAVTAL